MVAAPRQVHRARSVPARLERRDAEGVRVDNDRAAVRRQVGVEEGARRHDVDERLAGADAWKQLSWVSKAYLRIFCISKQA